MLAFGAKGPGYNPRRVHSCNFVKNSKLLFLNEDALAIVKSEVSHLLEATFQLAFRARFPARFPALPAH